LVTISIYWPKVDIGIFLQIILNHDLKYSISYIPGVFPTYFLHIAQDNGRKIFLLAGRSAAHPPTFSLQFLMTYPGGQAQLWLMSGRKNNKIIQILSRTMGTLLPVLAHISTQN
jgi:hypothetical protein